jgi:hypothetical protein
VKIFTIFNNIQNNNIIIISKATDSKVLNLENFLEKTVNKTNTLFLNQEESNKLTENKINELDKNQISLFLKLYLDTFSVKIKILILALLKRRNRTPFGMEYFLWKSKISLPYSQLIYKT